MRKIILLFLAVLGLGLAPVSAKKTFDRGIRKGVFVPKGTWMGGCMFSYREHISDDLHFIIIDNANSEGYTFKITPFAGYFIKDDIAVGLRATYTRTLIDLGGIDVNLGDDLSFELRDNKYQSHMMLVSGFMRTYMSIGGSKVFGFFNDLQLTYGAGQAKISQPSDKFDGTQGTFENRYRLQIGAAPGLSAFITNNIAVEVSVNVMGLKFDWINQLTNQVDESKMRKSSANFKIDLFSINLGMCLYF